jgi:drug/metabolite transporter superfamily protein YnfA
VILLLFVFQLVTGSPVCSVDRAAGTSSLSTVSATGVESLVTLLPEPIENPTISIDSSGNTAYVGTSSRVLQIDLGNGKQLANMTLPTGGTLRHVAWDGVYKRLFGIWQTNTDQISIIELTGGTLKTLVTLPSAGRVYLAYYGVTTHHYLMLLKYDDDKTPNSMTWYNMATNPPSLYETNPCNADLQSVAIDYINHNVWMVARNPNTMGFDFGIIHMNGTVQQVKSSSTMYVRAGAAATVDINTQFYYTELYTASGPYFAQYRLSDGTLVATSTKYDQQAIGYAIV